MFVMVAFIDGQVYFQTVIYWWELDVWFNYFLSCSCWCGCSFFYNRVIFQTWQVKWECAGRDYWQTVNSCFYFMGWWTDGWLTNNLKYKLLQWNTDMLYACLFLHQGHFEDMTGQVTMFCSGLVADRQLLVVLYGMMDWWLGDWTGYSAQNNE